MIATGNTTVGEIVAGDFRAAGVFHQFGIDFCCGGGRTLEAACQARNVKAEVVIRELERLSAQPDSSVARFDAWEADALATHIVREHHAYVRRVIPGTDSAPAEARPRPRGPAAGTAPGGASFRIRCRGDDRPHGEGGAGVVPLHHAIAEAARTSQRPPRSPFASIDNPISMMEHEHQWVGETMEKIRHLTHDYAVPADGCTTYRVAMQELEAFERDLHQHVHLENNILFPKARALARPAFA